MIRQHGRTVDCCLVTIEGATRWFVFNAKRSDSRDENLETTDLLRQASSPQAEDGEFLLQRQRFKEHGDSFASRYCYQEIANMSRGEAKK